MSEHDRRRQEIRSALVLGLDVEAQDPNMAGVLPNLSDLQLDWICSWLASEGIGKLSDPS